MVKNVKPEAATASHAPATAVAALPLPRRTRRVVVIANPKWLLRKIFLPLEITSDPVSPLDLYKRQTRDILSTPFILTLPCVDANSRLSMFALVDCPTIRPATPLGRIEDKRQFATFFTWVSFDRSGIHSTPNSFCSMASERDILSFVLVYVELSSLLEMCSEPSRPRDYICPFCVLVESRYRTSKRAGSELPRYEWDFSCGPGMRWLFLNSPNKTRPTTKKFQQVRYDPNISIQDTADINITGDIVHNQ